MDEVNFLAAMAANPDDPTPRLVMADWLEERGDSRAELMRIQEHLRSIDVPHRKNVERRMHKLLREGVQPVAPRMTNSLGMSFVLILPGEFLMGHEKKTGRYREQVCEGFWLGETVVTQRQWRSVMQSEPWKGEQDTWQHADCPATCVNWEEAQEFCRRLSETNGAGEHYALPTRAQWEYACRAGTTTAYSFGDDDASLGRYAWFRENAWEAGEEYAHRVGEKAANPWGLFDMHGNVWEWCQDAFDEDESSRVARGGSWRAFAGNTCWSSFRRWIFLGSREEELGFRVAYIPQQSKMNEGETESDDR